MSSDRIAIVTGANSGIGLETAIGLAESGLHVFMACRSAEKAAAAISVAFERVPNGRFSFLELDLANPDSVETCAADFRSRSDRLDILVNNAGIMSYSRTIGADGVEVQLRTNHLSHFQLTALLFPLIPDIPASRIVSLSSIAHKNGTIWFDDLTCGKAVDPGAAYAQSKLACLVFAIELDRRLRKAGRSVVSVATHPGVSRTQLFEDTPLYMKAALLFMGPLLTHGADKAAQPSLHAALDKQVKGGDYYGPTGIMEMNGKTGRARPSRRALSEETGARLWRVSEELTGTQFQIG